MKLTLLCALFAFCSSCFFTQKEPSLIDKINKVTLVKAFPSPDLFMGEVYCYFVFQNVVDTKQVTPELFSKYVKGGTLSLSFLSEYRSWLGTDEGQKCQKQVGDNFVMITPSLDKEYAIYLNKKIILNEGKVISRTIDHERLHVAFALFKENRLKIELLWDSYFKHEQKSFVTKHSGYQFNNKQVLHREFYAYSFEDNLKNGILFLSDSKAEVIYSGFENSKIDNMWKLKKIEKNSFRIQEDIVRRGDKAIKLTLRKGMIVGTGEDGKQTERVELKEKDDYHAKENEYHLYKFSFYIPIDFPLVNSRLVIGQWKQKGKSKPIIAQRFVDGRFFITVSVNGKSTKVLELSKEQSTELIGKWIDVKYKIKFSKDHGLLEIDFGKYSSTYSGELANGSEEKKFYFKFGLYRDEIEQDMTIYFDDYLHYKRPEIF